MIVPVPISQGERQNKSYTYDSLLQETGRRLLHVINGRTILISYILSPTAYPKYNQSPEKIYFLNPLF